MPALIVILSAGLAGAGARRNASAASAGKADITTNAGLFGDRVLVPEARASLKSRRADVDTAVLEYKANLGREAGKGRLRGTDRHGCGP